MLVLIVALIVFGPKKLPDLGRSLGKGIREFKGSVTGEDNDPQPTAAVEQHPVAVAPGRAVQSDTPAETRV
jgi:sec-independent protein translocase protein TatA